MADLVEFNSGLPSICIFSQWFDTTKPAMLVGSQQVFFIAGQFFLCTLQNRKDIQYFRVYFYF